METLTKDELIAMLPEPPEDLVTWLQKRGCFKQNWLIFRCGHEKEILSGENIPCLDVICTACGDTFKATRMEDMETNGCSHGYSNYSAHWGMAKDTPIRDGEKVRCPLCGAEAECVHVGRVHDGGEVEAHYPLIISKNGRNLILTSFRVYRTLDKSGQADYHIEKYEAYVFTERKTYRLCAWETYGFGNRSYYDKWELRKRCSDQYGSSKYIYYLGKNVFRSTFFENCKFKLYEKEARHKENYYGPFPISYLKFYKRHKQVENLLMQGFYKLVNELVEPQSCVNCEINWKEASPRRMLGLNKMDYEFLRQKNVYSEDIDEFKRVRAANLSLEPQEVMQVAHEFGYRLKDILKFGPDMMKRVRYFRKQAQRMNYNNPSGALNIWDDYVQLAKEADYNMTDESIKFPPRLKGAHDRLVMAKKYKEQKELIAKFKAMYEKLLPLSFKKDGLLIRPAKSEDELIKEGKILNHCVGGYGKTHCDGRSIFFIRHADKPDMPYFTLQLDVSDKRIIQNHGKNNIAPPSAVVAFQEYWLENIVRSQSKQERERIRCA